MTPLVPIRPSSVDVEPRSPSRFLPPVAAAPATVAQRLAAVARSAELAAAAGFAPRQGFARRCIGLDAAVAFGVIPLVFGGIATRSSDAKPLPPWFWLMAAAAVGVAGFLGWGVVRFWRAPVVREPAVVVSSEVKTSTRKGRVRHRYLVTLATPAGSHEFETDPATFADAGDGSAGIAWRRDRFLLAFRRVGA